MDVGAGGIEPVEEEIWVRTIGFRLGCFGRGKQHAKGLRVSRENVAPIFGNVAPARFKLAEAFQGILPVAYLLRGWIGEQRCNFGFFLGRFYEKISDVAKRVPCKQAPQSHECQRERKHSMELGIFHVATLSRVSSMVSTLSKSSG